MAFNTEMVIGSIRIGNARKRSSTYTGSLTNSLNGAVVAVSPSIYPIKIGSGSTSTSPPPQSSSSPPPAPAISSSLHEQQRKSSNSISLNLSKLLLRRSDSQNLSCNELNTIISGGGTVDGAILKHVGKKKKKKKKDQFQIWEPYNKETGMFNLLVLNDVIQYVSLTIKEIMVAEKTTKLDSFHIHGLLRRFWIGDNIVWVTIKNPVYQSLKQMYIRSLSFSGSPKGEEMLMDSGIIFGLPFITESDTNNYFKSRCWYSIEELQKIFSPPILNAVTKNPNLKKNDTALSFFYLIRKSFFKDKAQPQQLYILMSKAIRLIQYALLSEDCDEVKLNISPRLDPDKHAHPCQILYMIIIIMIFYDPVNVCYI